MVLSLWFKFPEDMSINFIISFYHIQLNQLHRNDAFELYLT